MTLQARPLRLSTADAGFEAAFQARLHWSADTDAGIEQAVEGILAAVRQRGDAAVLEFTARFDAMAVGSVRELELPATDLRAAFDGLPGVVVDRDIAVRRLVGMEVAIERQVRRLPRGIPGCRLRHPAISRSSRPAPARASSARSSCASLCAAVTIVRIRALSIATVG